MPYAYPLATVFFTVAGMVGGKVIAQVTPINHESPVTLAILLGAVGLAFVVGVTLTGIKRDIRSLKRSVHSLRKRMGDEDPTNDEEANEN